MADPICRWRNPYLKTIREFIEVLPKVEMLSTDARKIIESKFEGFFHTAYQLACQLGLYYEKDGIYYPRFSQEPTLNEIYNYTKIWISKYYVPNPYTKQGFNELKPKYIHSQFCKILFEKKQDVNWNIVKQIVFEEEIGNDDILSNTINCYSDVIKVKDNLLKLKDGVYYGDLVEYIEILPEFDRKDKEAFFYSFGLPKNIAQQKAIINKVFDYTLFNKSTQTSNLKFENELILRFTSSLLTKPFLILTGLSGSGKTKLAQAFVIWMCVDQLQYRIVPVGADWTNREPLLGFPNGLDSQSYVTPDSGALQLILEASKDENQNKPFFLILDEMNLSHVERYFADILSVMESQEKILLYSGLDRSDSDGSLIPSEIAWPKNLFIVGTVNIDETTYMFSPKVLDRASVIEFRVSESEMKQYLQEIKPLDLDKINGIGAGMAASFVELAKNKELFPKYPEKLNATLNQFFSELKKTGAEFGYRSASEICRFAAVANELDPTWEMDEIIDCAIMQKLLPKLHGSRNKLTKILPVLGGFCLEKNEKIKENYFEKFDSIEFSNDPNIKYKISFEKICRMYKNAVENGYASYAEA